MVITIFNDSLIKGGEHLLKRLDESNVTIDAALWFYFSDIQSWKLLLSLPDHIKHGPKSAYQAVQSAITELKEDLPFSLEDIGISKPEAPIFKLMRVAIKTGNGISGIRFSNNVINGQLVEDAYIYRLL